jgi:hypothetical protein
VDCDPLSPSAGTPARRGSVIATAAKPTTPEDAADAAELQGGVRDVMAKAADAGMNPKQVVAKAKAFAWGKNVKNKPKEKAGRPYPGKPKKRPPYKK